MQVSDRPDTTEELQESYDRIFSERIIEETRDFYQWILSLVRPKPAELVLDVACGVAGLVRVARDGGTEAYGVDLSGTALAIGRARGCPGVLANADGERLPFPAETFDHVTSLGSLEHYLRPEVGVQEIVRVMKPHGYAYLMLPNIYFWRYVLRAAIKGKGPSHSQELERFAARDDWRNLLESNGLSVVKVVRYDGGGMMGFSHRIVARVVPSNLTYCFVFICRRASNG